MGKGSCKSTLQLYKAWKHEIKEDSIYDNTPMSVILYRARANCLPLADRNRHTGGNTLCVLCNTESEDLEHLLLQCPEHAEIRACILELQQPYLENRMEIIGRYLFEVENLEQKKEFLYKIWKNREKKMKAMM